MISMEKSLLQSLRDTIRDVPDFPEPGIIFKDITPVLADARLWRAAIDGLCAAAGSQPVDKIVGIDARGFIFAAAVADRLGVGFVPVRKKGKLPWRTLETAYSLEYGQATIAMHEDAIRPGERVLLVDDVLATGGTAGAAIDLIHRAGGDLIGAAFFIELAFLHGRARLPQPLAVSSLVNYAE
jgi:adenine phosphoribosyltransferase